MLIDWIQTEDIQFNSFKPQFNKLNSITRNKLKLNENETEGESSYEINNWMDNEIDDWNRVAG